MAYNDYDGRVPMHHAYLCSVDTNLRALILEFGDTSVKQLYWLSLY